MGTTLTIGIPTYQRRGAVTRTVASLLHRELPPNVDVLVIDDGSSDGTFDALQEWTSNPRLRVLRNDSNRKFVGNFARLFEESPSDYLLVTSDEDEVAAEHLPALLAVLDSSHALMVSPQAIIDGDMFRGRAIQRPIRGREWRSASNYISGTTYEVATSRPLVKAISELAADNGAAEVYPQVLLTAELLLQGEGIWFPFPMTIKREQLRSHITDEKHGTYYYVAARWDQYLKFEAYLSELVSKSTTQAQADEARAMLEIHTSGLYGLLRQAIQEERPDLVAKFDRGARQSSLPKALQRSHAALRDPRGALVAARDRIAAKRATIYDDTA